MHFNSKDNIVLLLEFHHGKTGKKEKQKITLNWLWVHIYYGNTGDHTINLSPRVPAKDLENKFRDLLGIPIRYTSNA